MHKTSIPYQPIKSATISSKAPSGTQQLRAYWELTKPRLSFLSVITAIAGYLLAQPIGNWGIFAAVFLGTSLSAAAAATLNQWLEAHTDGLMERTRNRPLPSGQISPRRALYFGISLAVVGLFIMWKWVNPLSTALLVLTILSYLFIYTPLKRKSHWNTIIGAIPGALPPLTGWAAATDHLGSLGWILFGILFTWQIPHFMSIAWLYRDDYAKGNLKMLTVIDKSGNAAGCQASLYAIMMLVISLLPCWLGYTTWYFYGVIAFFAGVWMLSRSISFWRSSDKTAAAKRLFLASICYLPFVLLVIVTDRIFLM